MSNNKRRVIIVDGHKSCSKCKEILPIKCFYKSKQMPCGYSSQCIKCVKECGRKETESGKSKIRALKYYYTNQEEIKRKSVAKLLKSKYNLSLEEYLEMVKNQDNKCAICNKPETHRDSRTNRIKNLSVDHHHESGRIRGLLCCNCNTAIGLLKEDPKILESAIEYIINN